MSVGGVGRQPIYLDWARRDQQQLSPAAHVSNGTLYIGQVQYSDSGEYVCQGRDRQGNTAFSAITQITVVGE